MALTAEVVKTTVYGNTHVVFADVTFDDSYASGGEPLAAADLGLSDVFEILSVGAGIAGGYSFGYDHENGTLVAYEVAAVRDADPAGPLVEVADRTDLDAVTVRVFVVAA